MAYVVMAYVVMALYMLYAFCDCEGLFDGAKVIL